VRRRENPCSIRVESTQTIIVHTTGASLEESFLNCIKVPWRRLEKRLRLRRFSVSSISGLAGLEAESVSLRYSL